MEDPLPLLARLHVSDEDAAEVVRTMPSAESLRELGSRVERGLAGREGGPHPPPDCGELPLAPVHAILAAMGSILACHRAFGIPAGMSWATLAWLGTTMAAYRAVHGRAGIALGPWDWLRFTGWNYQAGRLEVTPYLIRTHPKMAGPLFWFDDAAAAQLGPGFRVGDPALGLHIPASGPLHPEECDEPLHGLKAAFAGRFPAGPPRIATCTSWLLDEQLAGYLPAESHIVAFQRRFHLVEGARECDGAALQALDGLRPDTSLHRAVAEHLREGGHWRMRTGWLELAD